MRIKLRKSEKKKFSRRMQKKMVVSFGIVSIAMIGLIGRLMYIEYTSGDKYEKIVLSQQEYDSKTIPYQRGNIVDSKGTILATSIDVYNVILDCKVLNQNKDEIDATVNALVTVFPDLTSEQLHQYLTETPDSQYVVLEKKLNYDKVQPFVEMQDDDENYPNINNDAVWFEKEYQREYPYGNLAASVIGFASSGNVGTIGLENYYNNTLNGVNGREYGYLNTDNNFEKTIKDATDGNNIVSTIDVNMQSIVEQKILDFNQANANTYRANEDGSKHTAAIVMDPNTGEILAMANYPTFDLNNPRDLSAYYSEDELIAMTEEEKMDILNSIWENFCVTYTYEPGSTAKPFTVATGLETGTIFEGDTFYCDGGEPFNGRTIHCVSRVGHGMETLQTSLMDSCNDALMQMSYRIGTENFIKYQNIFGFGLRTNVDLPGETRTDTLIYNETNMKPVDLATNAFGQNFNTTMIQLGSAFCSLINGGNYYQPRVIKEIQDAKGNVVQTISPTVLKQTISQETSDTVRGYLEAVVGEGTGGGAKVEGYSMGGKTGTAEKLPRGNDNYLVSFIGFAPADEPQVVVYVIVDEPNVESQSHSSYAQAIAKEIFTEILPYMNIYPDEGDNAVQPDPNAEEVVEDGIFEGNEDPIELTPAGE